jgi:hypothetical protein
LNEFLSLILENIRMKIKSLLLLSFFVFFITKANGQQATIGFGPEVSLPSGNSSNVSAVGLGGFVKAELDVSEKFALTAQGSLTSFLGKRFFGAKTPTITYIPIKAGLKYYTSPEFYFEGQMGAVMPLNGKTGTSFAISPGLAAFVNKKGADHKIDVGLRYESWTKSKFNFITFRVGYLFGL